MLGVKLILLATLAATLTVVGYAADHLPSKVKSAFDVVDLLEGQGYGPFHEVSFDDGVWEVEVQKKGQWFELLVDPQSGKILAEQREDVKRSAPDAAPLSTILHGMEQAGYIEITDVSFDHAGWEIDAFKSGVKHELHVNPKSGEIVSDRLDD